MQIDKEKKTIYKWGIKFDLHTLDEFVAKIDERIKNNKTPIHITGVNPETVVHAAQDDFMKQAVLESDFVNIDNTTILKTLRMLGYPAPERVATPDLFEALLELSNRNNYKVFILGAREFVLNNAIDNIRQDYPSLIIEGHHGYYPRENENLIVNEISIFAPTMLFIALPSPEKEKFILNYKNKIDVKLFLGVGGAVDCRAGLVKRASVKLRNSGLEGIHRALQNPIYYGNKYLTFYPKFFKIVFKSGKSKTSND
jgi:N-acetylglucosaminyldiphosphoundecaprenol N-acetyl-beta-D-mannosaminyltransferase